jgi:hypothetical protein
MTVFNCRWAGWDRIGSMNIGAFRSEVVSMLSPLVTMLSRAQINCTVDALYISVIGSTQREARSCDE